MPRLLSRFDLDRCPHCEVHKPNFGQHGGVINTASYENTNAREWAVYVCRHCGGAVLAYAIKGDTTGTVKEWFPTSNGIDEAIPERAREYLKQARESLHAPAGSIMLCASAVDAMLKAKEYTKGSLNDRIKKAVENHLLTTEMGTWADEVRLDANDQRHADEEASLPSTEDARRSTDFAKALAEFLFVLPARVKRGIAEASAPASEGSTPQP